MDKLSAEDLDFITELFKVDEKEARKVIDGKSFYNPLANKLEGKSALVVGNYVALSDDIQNWINKEENRIRYFPGYDGIEPFIAFAKDTVEMIKTHQIDEEKRKSEDMKSTKAANTPATVMEQFDRMKKSIPTQYFCSEPETSTKLTDRMQSRRVRFSVSQPPIEKSTVRR